MHFLSWKSSDVERSVQNSVILGIDPLHMVDTASAHSCCMTADHCDLWGHIVLAYKQYSSTKEFYHSTNGGKLFLRTNLSSADQQVGIRSRKGTKLYGYCQLIE